MFSNIRIQIKWALLITLAGLIWMLVEKTLGWHDELIAKQASYTMYYFPILIFLFMLAFWDMRRVHIGRLSWMNGFLYGAGLSLFIAGLAPGAQYITSHLISPDYFQNAIAYGLETEAASEEDLRSTFNFLNYVKMATMGSLISGLILSAIMALFTRRS